MIVSAAFASRARPQEKARPGGAARAPSGRRPPPSPARWSSASAAMYPKAAQYDVCVTRRQTASAAARSPAAVRRPSLKEVAKGVGFAASVAHELTAEEMRELDGEGDHLHHKVRDPLGRGGAAVASALTH